MTPCEHCGIPLTLGPADTHYPNCPMFIARSPSQARAQVAIEKADDISRDLLRRARNIAEARHFVEEARQHCEELPVNDNPTAANTQAALQSVFDALESVMDAVTNGVRAEASPTAAKPLVVSGSLRDVLERIDQACDLEEARQLAAQAMKILDDPAVTSNDLSLASPGMYCRVYPQIADRIVSFLKQHGRAHGSDVHELIHEFFAGKRNVNNIYDTEMFLTELVDSKQIKVGEYEPSQRWRASGESTTWGVGTKTLFWYELPS